MVGDAVLPGVKQSLLLRLHLFLRQSCEIDFEGLLLSPQMVLRTCPWQREL